MECTQTRLLAFCSPAIQVLYRLLLVYIVRSSVGVGEVPSRYEIRSWCGKPINVEKETFMSINSEKGTFMTRRVRGRAEYYE